MDDELAISYSLKEVLGDIKADIRSTREDIRAVNDRLSVIEHERANKKAGWEIRLTLVAITAALMSGLGTVILALHG